MSYKIDGIALKRRTTPEDKLCCEACQNTQTDIYLCNLCHLLCCSTCTKSHACPNEPLEGTFKFEKIESDVRRPLELRKKLSEAGNPRFLDFSVTKSEVNRSCLRCYITQASKICLQCKIKYYCEHCFKSIHASSKLSSHQTSQISQNKEKLNNYGSFQTKAITKASNFTENNRILRTDSLQSSYQHDNYFNSLQANLIIIKNSLMKAYGARQNEVKESISFVTKSFEGLMEAVKLKLFEVTMKIKDNQRLTLQSMDDLKKSVNSQEKVLANLKYLVHQQQSLIPLTVISYKKEACERQINDLIDLVELNSYKDPMDRKYTEIKEELEQISLKVSKIQFKKTGLQFEKMDSSKISSVSNHTSRNEKNNSYIKIPLNLASIKPVEKLTSSLITPKKSSNQIKTPKESQNLINKSLFLSSTHMNCPEDDADKLLNGIKGLNFDGKKRLQKKKMDNSHDKRLFNAGLMSPKANIKKFDRNTQNTGKLKISKTGMNIQKTKHMIKQIRNEMIEFSSRFNMEKEATERSATESCSLEISQLSIESALDKSIKS